MPLSSAAFSFCDCRGSCWGFGSSETNIVKNNLVKHLLCMILRVVEIDGRHAHARACRPSIPRVTQVFRRQTGCRRRKSRRRRQIRRIRAQNLFFTFVCFVSARRFSSDTSIT